MFHEMEKFLTKRKPLIDYSIGNRKKMQHGECNIHT